MKKIFTLLFALIFSVQYAQSQCNISIAQVPSIDPCSGPTLVSAFTGNAPTVGDIFYIRDSNPWGADIYDSIMDEVFGAGIWIPKTYANATPATVFAPTTQFVYIEGSTGNEAAQFAYLAANLPAIEAWVNAGGRLLLNRAPNIGPVITDFGFGGVTNTYTAPQNFATVTPMHPIGAGPFLPTLYNGISGGAYSHSYITGGSPIITGSGYNILTEKNWGSGLVLFGGYTSASFHTPPLEARNLFKNWLYYTASSTQPDSYLWMPGAATTSSIVPSMSGIYTVTATQSGCTTTATVSVIVPIPIIINIAINVNTVTINATGGTPPYTYGMFPPGGMSPNNVFNNLCGGAYTVVVQDSLGCNQTTTLFLQNFNTISYLTDSACNSYVFYSDTITASGVYQHNLVNALGCDSTVVLNLTINTLTASITQVADTLYASNAGATYQWLDCNTNTIIPGANSQMFSPTISGIYAVIETQNGCIDTSTCTTFVITRTKDFNENNYQKIYPNPTTDIVYIESKHTISEINIYNTLMQKVYTQKINNTHTAQLSTKTLSTGIYYIKIDQAQMKKLIIEK